MSLMDASALGARRLARAQSRWRDSARLVSMRWEVLLAVGPEARALAFASYAAALDAEEAAAATLARIVSSPAA